MAVCITDTKGQFCIEKKDEGDFIQISSIGYSTKNLPVSAFATSRTIKMEIEAGMLNEIVVSKTRPKTKLLGDAVVTTIEGSILEHAFSFACRIVSIRQTASIREREQVRMQRTECNPHVMANKKSNSLIKM